MVKFKLLKNILAGGWRLAGWQLADHAAVMTYNFRRLF